MLYIFFLTILLSPSLAYAYIDAGTGSLIIQAVIAGLASVLVFFGSIKTMILNLLKKKNKNND